jgi:hypothetical protein
VLSFLLCNVDLQGELSLHTRVQLGELKRAATKTKADAALFSLSRSSRAD